MTSTSRNHALAVLGILEKNAEHRARVVHSQDTLLVQISAEDGFGWTVIAIDRKTREWSVAQRLRQNDAATAAYELLYE